ncbi:MAG: HAD family hydrolase [Gammaproteobacteria bacterium]|nr:HAD family hydrolase [Gammaproteobacteria bacterium]
MREIKAISFDLDDTLWECDPVIQRAEHSLLEFLTSRCELIRQRYTLERYHEHKLAFMRENVHLQGDVSRMRQALLRHLLADCEAHRDLADEAYAHFYRVRSQVELYDDSLAALERLSRRYRLAALTNGNADLHQIGIAGLFSQIHTASLECPAKPEAHMFRITCEAFAIEPHQLLHVGDNPETDIEGARNAGAVTVWINRNAMDWPETLQPADYEVRDLNELIELLPVEG